MEIVTPKVISVCQLNSYIKGMLDSDNKLKNILLCGEISNFTNHYRTGHFYLTLKDDKSSIKAVMFRTYAERIKFTPENGMKVIAFGSVSVFERDGQYQFYIENMEPDGIGSLNLAFEQLKEKLSKEGLFSPEHKKPIPSYPNTIGVVTSPTGAAFQDIINVLKRRWPLSNILISPTAVQGEFAPSQIVNAIKRLDTSGLSDVIIVARGGGSIEDLWAFNDEKVARAIYNCSTPVISGVGHETDFTITDFVADMRAPTPSAAAEISVPSQVEEMERISNLCIRAQKNILSRIDRGRTEINRMMDRNVMRSPAMLINERRLLLDSYSEKMNYYVSKKLDAELSRLSLSAGKLDAYSPLKVLSRGYTIPQKEDGTIAKSIGNIKIGENINLKFIDGQAVCLVEEIKNG